jgi:hypothetical protein
VARVASEAAEATLATRVRDGAEGGRQGGLRQHRRDDGRLDGGGEREAAREAHADHADAGTARLGVQAARERAEVGRDRPIGPAGERRELARHAHAQGGGREVAAGRGTTRSADDRGHRDAEPRLDEQVGEADHLGGRTGDLGDQNDAGAGAASKHPVGEARGGEVRGIPSLVEAVAHITPSVVAVARAPRRDRVPLR